MKKDNGMSRRGFLDLSIKSTIATTAVISGFPTIVPASVFGKNAPSNRITIGAIGTGRISRGHDMPGVWKFDNAQIIAVCDVDSNRAKLAKDLVVDTYSKKNGKPYDGVNVYTDYRELLNNKDIDAVLVSTPDHWHAPIVISSVRAGKDVYMQKPASLTISEGRAMADAVKQTKRIVQVGSQQRSSWQFRYAAELVRNGRIGELKTVYVGLPVTRGRS
jgi:predicted dehydrogenase